MLATSSDNALPVYLHGITKLGEQYHARYHHPVKRESF